MNPFSHVDLRVADLAAARAFYGVLLGELGFRLVVDTPEKLVFSGRGDLPARPFFPIVQSATHVPSENRIAFWLPSRAEVDRVAALVRAAGARDFEAPGPCPEYTTTYYAAFFADPTGNRLELVHRET